MTRNANFCGTLIIFIEPLGTLQFFSKDTAKEYDVKTENIKTRNMYRNSFFKIKIYVCILS